MEALERRAGLAVTPLIVVAVVVAYITSEGLTAYVDSRVGSAVDDAPPVGTEAVTA